MKMKTFIIGLLLLTINSYSQDKGLNFSLSAGITTPTGSYAKEARPSVSEAFPVGAKLTDFIGYKKTRKGKYQFNLDANYNFGKFGAGFSVGSFSHKLSKFKYNQPIPTSFNGGNISGFYYGIGPNYNLNSGKFKIILMARAGMMNIKYDGFSGFYRGTDVTNPVEILTTTVNSKSENNLLYTSFGAQFSYALSNKLSLFTKIDYLTTLGSNLKVDDTYYLPFDIDSNGEINAFDVGHFTLIDYKRKTTRSINPQMLNVGVGISYTIGRKKSKSKDEGGNNNMTLKSGTDSQNNNSNSKIYAGTNGEFEISNDQDPNGFYSFTPGVAFSGTGTAYLPFLAATVAVKFSNIKVDNQAHLIHGKIIVKSNPDEPTFPRQWLMSSLGSLTSFSHNQVQSIMDWADDQSNAVPGLEYLGNNGPLQAVNNPTITTPFIMELDPNANNDSRFAITEMVFLPTESEFNAVVAMDTPAEWNSTDQIGFIAKGVKFHTNDIVGPTERAEIVSDIAVGNANNDISFKFKSAADPSNPNHPGCYIEWNENGFQQFGIEIEASFTRDWFLPIPDDGTLKSTATLLGQGTWGNMILSGSFAKSKIVTAHGMSIEATNLNFDMSDSMNPANISFPAEYEDLPNANTDNTWRGFYAENVTVELPDDIKNNQNTPITVGIDNFIIDNQGLTMDVFAHNIIQWPQANISDLNASIDTLSVKILTNSLSEFQIKGKINIPTSNVNTIQNPLAYAGYYIPQNQVANNASIPQNLNLSNGDNVLYLTISPTGPVHSDLFKGDLELDPNSEIFALKSGFLRYFGINLQGTLKYDHVNLGDLHDATINLPFQDLSFTYLVEHNPANSSSNSSSNSSPNLEVTPPTWGLSGQHEGHGFPLTINNIAYESLPINGTEDLHGKLNFDVLLNLSGNSSSISATTGLGVEFKIENDSIHDKRFKPEYITTHIDSLAVDAHLKAVNIAGNLYMQSNDSIYGKRIGGSLLAAFKGGVSVGVAGEFGTTTYQNNNNKYRYWRVEANADFPNGIAFTSGLAFYGFTGGVYNNMDLQINTTDPSNIIQTYIPHYAMFGMKVGATIGGTPLVDAFNADVVLEGVFSNSGQGMQYIGIGGNFGTNATIADRRIGKGKINGNFLVQYDFPNKHFALNANATINASPITTPSPAWLALDIDGLHNKWSFEFGKPDYSSSSPNNLMNTVKIDLGGGGINLYEYYMFGNNLPNVNGFTYRFKDAYASAMGNTPGFGTNVGNISQDATAQLGTGMALGLGFEVNKEFDDQHIVGNYYLGGDIHSGAEVNLSFMRYTGACGQYNPVGINGWRAKGSLGVYARASAEIKRKNNNPKAWTIADLRAGAWMHGEFPNPYYVRGAIDGAAKIGCVSENNCLLNRSVHVDFEKGNSCNNSQNNSTPIYQQQYATDEFNNDLINHIAPDQNWNFPVVSPIAVRYNFEPNEVFHVSEQQSNGSIINRTFKMVTSVHFIKASSVSNNIPQFTSNNMLTVAHMGLEHHINDIGEYQYILKPLSLSVNSNALNTMIPNPNPPVLQQAQVHRQPASLVINPSGNVNQPLNLTPITMNANALANVQAYQLPIIPSPYLNHLSLNTFYKFTVEATIKEFNYNTNQWENAHNTDGSVVQETYSKVFRTGPILLPSIDIYSNLSNNLSTH